MLARHAGASRFAYNQCLRLVTDALAAKGAEPQVKVPWPGFDLINAFNAWKRGEAGRVFVAAPEGTITKQVTGLGWRHEVSAQVFEEAAVDLGRALFFLRPRQYQPGRSPRAGFPEVETQGALSDSFRLRNKHGKGGAFSIRVGRAIPCSDPVNDRRSAASAEHTVAAATAPTRSPIRPQHRAAPRWRRAARSCSPRSAGMAPAGCEPQRTSPRFPSTRRHKPGLPMTADAGFVGVDRGLPRSW